MASLSLLLQKSNTIW